jgi:hypothetical protein
MRIQPFTRVVCAVVVVLALVVLTAAPAQARPSGPPRLKLDVSWLGSALGWLSTFFGSEDTERPAQTKKKPTSSGSGDDGGGVQPMTGVCIDPSGAPAPCYTGP